ncbi:MAG TPA: hypothetical protein VFY39_14525 [Gammaproteobacteria bacterium]|nr:hypothetical protein [Gammaproteobacteria bacterium]
MKINTRRAGIGLGTVLLCAWPLFASAQPGAFGGGYGPPLEVVPLSKKFTTSEQYYNYLLEQAKGGTQHTLTSVPRWDGLWVTAGNTHMSLFIDTGNFGGKVKEGVLTPAYEKAYKERWRQQTEEGEVRYDRLTDCEPPGMPRFLLEPYTHEFINLPDESYQILDLGPSVRRVYIGQEHKNLLGTHSWYGDTIGFWDGDKLITNTKYLYPADFTRWSPMTSNQFEDVEIWELKHYSGGIDRLEVQATFFDKYAFVKPLTAVYAFRRATKLEKAGYRVPQWECQQSGNSYKDANGRTNYHLPGEQGFKDVRGATQFPELPGQTRDPIYNTTLPAAPTTKEGDAQ